MKILYIHQYFKSPMEGGAIRSYYIASAMVDDGMEVHVVTSHNSKKLIVKDVEGIKVHYLPVFYDNKYGVLRRFWSFLRFLIIANSYIKKIDHDICYATSTPLTVGLIAVWNKWRNKKPFYFEVRDIWPEAPVQLGILKNKLLVGLSYKLEKLIYHRAERIICLSPSIENDIKKRYLYLNTLRVPNMSDCLFYSLEEKSRAMLRKFDVRDDEFVISYFGALGWVNHLEYLLEEALECQNEGLTVRFFIAGKGGQELALKDLASEKGLRNLEFVGHLNKFELRELLNVTDAAYISFLNYKVLEANSPNKFFDGIAAGKIIITNVRGWIKELVDDHQCGFYVNPEKPGDLTAKLRPYLGDADLIETQKIRSRKLAQEQFSRTMLVKEIIREIKPIVSSESRHLGL